MSGQQVEARPKRTQRQRTPDWRMPRGTIKVNHATQWANPFEVGHHYVMRDGLPKRTRFPDRHKDAQQVSDHTQAVDLFRMHAATWDQRHVVGMLAGCDLACWCPLDQPCHADVLLELANGAGS